VIIEAGLCAVPTVATAVGAVSDMIDDGTSGFVTAGDSPAEIGAALAAAIERSTDQGKAALHKMRENYTWEAVVPSWLNLLETMQHC